MHSYLSQGDCMKNYIYLCFSTTSIYSFQNYIDLYFPPIFIKEFPLLTSGSLTLTTTPIQRGARLIVMDQRLNLLNRLSSPETDTTADIGGGGPGGQGSEVPLLLPRGLQDLFSPLPPRRQGSCCALSMGMILLH